MWVWDCIHLSISTIVQIAEDIHTEDGKEDTCLGSCGKAKFFLSSNLRSQTQQVQAHDAFEQHLSLALAQGLPT